MLLILKCRDDVYPQGKIPPGELVNPVEHRVAAGVEAAALTRRVKFASGRERREQLVPMRVQALGVLIPLRGSRAFALGDHAGRGSGDRGPTSVLKHGGQSQDLTGPHRRFRIMCAQVSIFCDRNSTIFVDFNE